MESRGRAQDAVRATMAGAVIDAGERHGTARRAEP